jgi:ribosomal protein S18 acetylase RimI-like enzyme
METQSPIIYKLAEAHNLESLVDCVQQCFPAPNGETMACELNVLPEDYYPFTRLVCEKAIEEKLSWLALDNSERVIGFCLSEPMSTAPLYSDHSLSEKLFPLFALLEELDNRYLINTAETPEQMFHLYMLGVLPIFSGKGIGRELLKGSVNFGRELGYKVAIAEATGTGSQTLCRNLGFESKATVPYEDFIFAGKHPFKGIKSPRSCVLMEKLLLP